MEIVVKARHTDVDDAFRACVRDKLARVERLDSRLDQVEAEVSQERNPRLSDSRVRVELTCRRRGPVIRAEAAAADEYAALDLAVDKLEMRLRRAADRRRVHHGSRTPVSVATATAAVAPAPDDRQPAAADDGPEEQPFVVREKVHVAAPMTLDQALFEMELVGHDFYLYVDEGDGTPSVVYRRKGYDYGVVRLRRSAEDGA